MASKHLSERNKWQDKAGIGGQKSEHAFNNIMETYLADTIFDVEFQPKDLQSIYGIRISKTGRSNPHGVRPDGVIRNTENGKSIYVEIKHQAAAGNAHERACKYMMPGIRQAAFDISKLDSGIIPFWWIFTGGIANDTHYRQEITKWYQGINPHVLLWGQTSDESVLIQHFDTHIRPLLQ